jgi:hypothetical protein
MGNTLKGSWPGPRVVVVFSRCCSWAVGYLISDEKGSNNVFGQQLLADDEGDRRARLPPVRERRGLLRALERSLADVSRCREVAGVLICRLPYPLRIDLRSREQPKVTAD